MRNIPLELCNGGVCAAVRSEREAKTEAVPLTLGLFAAFNRNSNLTINKFQ